MELYTRIEMPHAPFLFSYENRITLMGSCFAENIGRKLEENKLRVDINPFGTLYNPASVAKGLRELIRPEPFRTSDLFAHEGMYHSFAHHSRFSATSEEECLSLMNDRLAESSAFLLRADRLIITFGTAYVYRLKSDGRIVSNCHKLPENLFERERLSVDDIVEDWESSLLALWEWNPDLRVLFTVSPIRHWKDGAHENQLSKATLLLAIESLRTRHADRIAYFPAYELLMDELRDYRFYAEDMLHPSQQAIEYIWQRFGESSLTKETKDFLKKWDPIRKAIQHKPFRPESETYERFLRQTLERTERIARSYPALDFSEEVGQIRSKLNAFRH